MPELTENLGQSTRVSFANRAGRVHLPVVGRDIALRDESTMAHQPMFELNLTAELCGRLIDSTRVQIETRGVQRAFNLATLKCRCRLHDS